MATIGTSNFTSAEVVAEVRGSTQSFSSNDDDIRALAGKTSGSYSSADWAGKSALPALAFSPSQLSGYKGWFEIYITLSNGSIAFLFDDWAISNPPETFVTVGENETLLDFEFKIDSSLSPDGFTSWKAFTSSNGSYAHPAIEIDDFDAGGKMYLRRAAKPDEVAVCVLS